MQIYITTPLFSVDGFLKSLSWSWSNRIVKWKFLPWYPKSPCRHVTFVATNPHKGGVWPWLYVQALLFSFIFSSSGGAHFTSPTLLCVVCSVAQSHQTLCNPMDCISPGSSVCGIFQARIPGCVAISYSWGSSWCRNAPALAGRFFTTVPPGKPWSESKWK